MRKRPNEQDFWRAFDAASEVIAETRSKMRMDPAEHLAGVALMALIRAIDQPDNPHLRRKFLVGIQNLEARSRKCPISWSALCIVASEVLKRHEHYDDVDSLFDELRLVRSWAVDVLGDQARERDQQRRPRPKPRMRPALMNHVRDEAILAAVWRLMDHPGKHWGLNDYRGKTRCGKILGEDCSLEGGSKCDAIGMAWNQVGPVVGYSTVERLYRSLMVETVENLFITDRELPTLS